MCVLTFKSWLSFPASAKSKVVLPELGGPKSSVILRKEKKKIVGGQLVLMEEKKGRTANCHKLIIMLKAGPTDTPLNNNNNNSNLNQCYKQQKSWNVATKLNAPGSENVSKYGNFFSKTFLKKWQFSFSKYKRNKWLNIPSLFSFFSCFFSWSPGCEN